MLFGTASPTPYDLRFSAFGIPVRVHPLFWVFSAAMGWSGHDLRLTLIWVVCVFVSILVHELGHALTARYFRWHSEIVLYIFGGYASYVPTWNHSTGRAILVTAAGPGAGFLLYGVVLLIEQALWRQHVPISKYAFYAFLQLEHINLFWGFVNLLPVYPLDGGQITRALLVHFRPVDGAVITHRLSLIVALAGAYFAYHYGMFNLVIFAAAFAFLNFEALQNNGRYR